MNAVVESESDYRWQPDLVERHSLTLIGPEGWLAHVLRGENGWYGYTTYAEEACVEDQPSLQPVLDAMHALVAQCRWREEVDGPRCGGERAAHSPFCRAHTSVFRASIGPVTVYYGGPVESDAVTEAADDRYPH